MAKQRFVIRHPSGKFFSHCDTDGTFEEIVPVNGEKKVFDRPLLVPAFSGHGASKFDTSDDAAAMMKHPHLNPSPTNPDATFKDCTVEIADE